MTIFQAAAAKENSRPIFAHDKNDTISALRMKNALSVINYNACACYFWEEEKSRGHGD